MLTRRRDRLVPDHPDTLASMHSLIAIYSRAGQHDRALELAEEVLGRADNHLTGCGKLSRIGWLTHHLGGATSRRFELTDEQHQRIAHLLPGKPSDPGATARDNRPFMGAIPWIARTGAPWPDLPERFGKQNSVYQRFNRWAESGVLARIMEALGGDADLEQLMIDSTVIRAHRHSAGAGRKGASRRSAARAGA